MAELPVSVALVTAPSQEAAERIVRALVEERLAACGSIVPGMTSIYGWEGAIRQEAEVLIVLKTTRVAAPRLIARVKELHPYDVPEVLALPVTAGLDAYTAWVAASVHD
ncbi:MAG TPA: divalent-cation tolerance protein CutA [Longimicrobiales bacterium]